MGKFFETVVLESHAMASPLRTEWMNASLNFLAKSMNSPKDFSLELRESLMKVVAQVWADLFFMKERVKAIFFSSVLYTSLLTIRYTCTEFNQTIALVGVPSKLLG